MYTTETPRWGILRNGQLLCRHRQLLAKPVLQVVISPDVSGRLRQLKQLAKSLFLCSSFKHAWLLWQQHVLFASWGERSQLQSPEQTNAWQKAKNTKFRVCLKPSWTYWLHRLQKLLTCRSNLQHFVNLSNVLFVVLPHSIGRDRKSSPAKHHDKHWLSTLQMLPVNPEKGKYPMYPLSEYPISRSLSKACFQLVPDTAFLPPHSPLELYCIQWKIEKEKAYGLHGLVDWCGWFDILSVEVLETILYVHRLRFFGCTFSNSRKVFTSVIRTRSGVGVPTASKLQCAKSHEATCKSWVRHNWKVKAPEVARAVWPKHWKTSVKNQRHKD